MTPEQLEERKRARELVLRAVHDLTDGDELTMVDDQEVISKTGLPQKECDDALVFLENQGLIVNRAIGGAYSLTHRGLLAFERLHEPRPKPPPSTTSSPVVVQHFNGPVGAVQTGNNNTAQVVQQSGASIQEIVSLLDALKKEAGSLPKEVQGEIVEHIDDLSAEMKGAQKPSRLKAGILALFHASKSAVDFSLKVVGLANKLGFKLPPGEG